MRIPVSLHPKGIAHALHQRLIRISEAINGGIAFGQTPTGPTIWSCENLDAVHVLVSIGVANTNTSVTHNLGRIPTGFFVVVNTSGGVIYNGTVAWDSTTISLKTTVAGTFKLIIY